MIDRDKQEITFSLDGNDVTLPIDRACEIAHGILRDAAQFKMETRSEKPRPWTPDMIEDWNQANAEDRLLIEAKRGKPVYP